ncbi:hypothetical protein [Xenorhabdus szentirmaii]|uniref:Uncharacterized protein n=2 Tax=Xenorhabdus szentirmaii TaxID=290112 RepID=W1J0A5_9GAMM|nr:MULTISPECIES: hypothetical protein [Xenorhabdus]MBD2781261.1 hypothetical protein [Xenorhabdus sp. 38]MBD2792745.1 hypothetical protein [Xenorhabdus sp. CUL]MBD2800421.1 hypothetical protein [Xenorhabdus sp. M]MBD2804124.1 hypothetical protein [Xenorhabdus sp. ZM]MBD2820377.1 hypothetical protein [Xenorhabdus sp. 42]
MKRPFSVWVMLVGLLIFSLDHFIGIIKLVNVIQVYFKQLESTSTIHYFIVYLVVKTAVFGIFILGFISTLSPKKHAKKVLLLAWTIFIFVFLIRQYEAYYEIDDRYLKYDNDSERAGALIAAAIQFTLYLSVLINLIFSKRTANYLKKNNNKSQVDSTLSDNKI